MLLLPPSHSTFTSLHSQKKELGNIEDGFRLCCTRSHLLIAASMVAVSQADTVVVGGSEGWRLGFNYTNWALQHGRFYINDKLVFKYDPPSNNTSPHDVYLLPNLWSYLTCDLKKATLLANATQGGGDGFEYVLNKWRLYYFACSVGNGSHCKDGMKFFAMPWPRWNS
ncbi:hypothetical protein L1049_025420 [Liquidambar formosana]|uniref:Phytocyanin domain-containing protein n=1 Tax=Liquidambar formosana TaxID=63359 RepID=A0AAP0R4K9_LIQFO